MTNKMPLLAAGSLLLAAGLAQAATTPEQLLEQLRTNTRDALQWEQQSATAYQLLRATSSTPLLVDQSNAPALQRAMNFLTQFGQLLDVSAPAEQFELLRVSDDRAGNQHVHLAQQHAGLPVFGSRLVVHMNDQGIYGVSGSVIPDLDALPTSATVSAEVQRAAALRQVAKSAPEAELSIESERLMVYRSGVLRGVEGRNYLAREIMVRSARGDVRERLIFDAVDGGLINRINQIHEVKNREIYTPNQDVPPVITEGSAAAPADVPLAGDTTSDPASRAPRLPQDNLYIFAGGTYDLYTNLFGFEGYDFGTTSPEEQVQKSVYLINDQCPNAYWNGDSTNYCPGFDADDVVSHEWSHAYTEYTHGLIYQYQSGALNESYSDIFGEIYDLVNGLEGPLGVTLTEGEYFENGGSRWVLGEDLSETAAALLLRDMWDPDNFSVNVPLTGIEVLNTGSPGSVITSENYYCESGDGGGVHTNSAVPNHAFAMLVDGKSFNGVDIPAIGMTRAAHIYFHAALNYQTPTTNFAQHADALAQSCADLIGAPLNDVLGQPSPDVVDASTCAAVEAAMLAVEMREDPAEKCGYLPLLLPDDETPNLCEDGSGPVADFSETWEGASELPNGWEFTENLTGDTSEGTTWEVIGDLPHDRAGQAVFVANTFGGSCTPGGDISASFQLDSPEITVSADDSKLSMSHLMQSEFGYDGGNIKASINGGDFTLIPAEAIVWNSYNTDLEPGAATPVPDPTGLTGGGNTNPMGGEGAWSGSDEGESFSRWGVSHIDLAALGVAAGDTLRIRFEFGQDGCNGNLGWFVDDVSVSHCVAGQPNGNGVPQTSGGGSSPTTPTTPTTPGGSGSESPRGGASGVLVLMLMMLGLARRRV